MPKNLVKGQDAVDVAAYVASVAGTGSATAKPPSQLGNDGKTIFQSECASCHTLAAAGTHGTIGPNLDQLKPSETIVQHQVEVGGGVMPAFRGHAHRRPDHRGREVRRDLRRQVGARHLRCRAPLLGSASTDRNVRHPVANRGLERVVPGDHDLVCAERA